MILSKEFPYLNNHGSNTCFLYQISSPRGCGLCTHASSTETLFKFLWTTNVHREWKNPFSCALFQLKQTTSFHSGRVLGLQLSILGEIKILLKLIKTMDLPSKKKKKKQTDVCIHLHTFRILYISSWSHGAHMSEVVALGFYIKPQSVLPPIFVEYLIWPGTPLCMMARVLPKNRG